MKRRLLGISIFIFAAGLFSAFTSDDDFQERGRKKLKALIIDGQNNHGAWPKTTMIMKDYLEQIGFAVDIERTKFTWQGPHNDNDEGMGEARRKQLQVQYPLSGKQTVEMEKAMPDSTYFPTFENYDLVVSNFGWLAAPLPAKTMAALEKFVSKGGGLIIIHAADNSWPEWLEYNRMIGLGAWGNRNEKDGPFVYFNDNGELVRDTSPGPAGSHGKQHEFLVKIRDTNHPITKGMPSEWLHAKDELYERLRGPAENMNVLATSYSDPEKNGSGTRRHEPMLMAINYGNGRVFHTPLGHTDYSMECVGFIITFQRAAEWAATGTVKKQNLPPDFPTATEVRTRKWNK
jgi:uncharacterized protein